MKESRVYARHTIRQHAGVQRDTYVYAEDTALLVVLLAEVVEVDIKVVVTVHSGDAVVMGAVVQLLQFVCIEPSVYIEP